MPSACSLEAGDELIRSEISSDIFAVPAGFPAKPSLTSDKKNALQVQQPAGRFIGSYSTVVKGQRFLYWPSFRRKPPDNPSCTKTQPLIEMPCRPIAFDDRIELQHAEADFPGFCQAVGDQLFPRCDAPAGRPHQLLALAI